MCHGHRSPGESTIVAANREARSYSAGSRFGPPGRRYKAPGAAPLPLNGRAGQRRSCALVGETPAGTSFCASGAALLVAHWQQANHAPRALPRCTQRPVETGRIAPGLPATRFPSPRRDGYALLSRRALGTTTSALSFGSPVSDAGPDISPGRLRIPPASGVPDEVSGLDRSTVAPWCCRPELRARVSVRPMRQIAHTCRIGGSRHFQHSKSTVPLLAIAFRGRAQVLRSECGSPHYSLYFGAICSLRRCPDSFALLFGP